MTVGLDLHNSSSSRGPYIISMLLSTLPQTISKCAWCAHQCRVSYQESSGAEELRSETGSLSTGYSCRPKTPTPPWRPRCYPSMNSWLRPPLTGRTGIKAGEKPATQPKMHPDPLRTLSASAPRLAIPAGRSNEIASQKILLHTQIPYGRVNSSNRSWDISESS